jgi:hypothetical protein
MKRAVLITLAVMGFAFLAACSSQPAAKLLEPQTPREEALKSIYDRYRGSLILAGAEKYTVVSGDMLSAISRARYDNGFYYPLIMAASNDVVLDYDRIAPGMELTIPNLQRNLDNSRARNAIKSLLEDVAKMEEDRNRPQDAEGLRGLAASL